MATSIQTSFSGGEISPELWGRVDLAKWRQGASTMRNMFVSYRGGALSRPGYAYVGTCKQPGTSAPPRDIPFQFSLNQGIVLEFGDTYLRFKSDGAYVVEATKAISGATNANPGTLTITAHGYSNGDWIFITGMLGMTELDGLTWIVASHATNTVTLTDLFGNPVDTTNFGTYTSGGTAARLYTVATPYAAVDLPYLKYTQSADTMTLTCVNTETSTEYPPYDLVRNGNTSWTLTQESFASIIAAPTITLVTAKNSTTVNTWYSYMVTAVDLTTGQESVASASMQVQNNDISVNAGSNVINWSQVAGAGSYNVYRATPTYSSGVPVGTLYGYIGSALGNSFVDTNITADFSVVPPVHANPFARGAILGVVMTANGTNYTQATVGYTVTTSTGSGFVGVPVITGSPGAVSGFYVVNPGANYKPGDTVHLTDSGTGTGATATLTIGPQVGTYPGVVSYFQERRAYAATLNNPDTYYMSQPGAFLNMDSSVPITASDAITGTPWSQQVNGIQFLVQMPSGLIVLTGKGAWQLTGGNSASFTAIDQNATPQAYNGCHDHVQPITINYDILYVQAKGSIVRDLSYNFFVNIYTGTDMTVLSSHLFENYQIVQWAYAEEPFKIVWCVRNDGTLLSLTYLKEQDVYGWARHDTNGFVHCVCSITEPPVDAVYLITHRYVQGQWMYYSERMDNRTWPTVENAFCVDAGLQYPQTSPNATLTAAAAEGTANISGVNLISGGTGYTSPSIVANDPSGLGSGATFTAVLSGGVITKILAVTQGQNYSVGGWYLTIADPTGTGAVAQPIVTNNVTFTADSAVFTSAMVGSVIRVGSVNPVTANIGQEALFPGSGKATITSFVSTTQVVANITVPLATVPNDPNATPIPAVSGNWSISVPTNTVSGLNHLEGLTVSILADGSVIPQQVVTGGAVTLPALYSAITVGLPFTWQLQTLYLDPPGVQPTMQTKRKNVQSVGVRLASSRGVTVGSNQPDASTQPNGIAPPWTDMIQIKERTSLTGGGSPIPLKTGDEFINIKGDWAIPGQVAFQGADPLPASILAVVPYFVPGDIAAPQQ